MKSIVVVGAQWGDEGKGQGGRLPGGVVRLHRAVCRRPQRGPHGDHSQGTAIVLQLIPCGILRPKQHAIIGSGVVVDPAALVAELEMLAKSWHRRHRAAAHQQSRAPDFPVSPADGKGGRSGARRRRRLGPLRAASARLTKIKWRGRELRVGELLDPSAFREKAARVSAEKNRMRKARTARKLDYGKEWRSNISALGERLRPSFATPPSLMNRALDAGKSVLFEGAQGTMLDIDFGTYPFVTSSNAISGGASTGSASAPTGIATSSA